MRILQVFLFAFAILSIVQAIGVDDVEDNLLEDGEEIYLDDEVGED
jgi:hypothetical protein